jgi:hypothetical protein
VNDPQAFGTKAVERSQESRPETAWYVFRTEAKRNVLGQEKPGQQLAVEVAAGRLQPGLAVDVVQRIGLQSI